ncbi:MmgE/PrpD family protein [Aurantimonas sp. C2-6-R+9]|uniref:MmgE/PrpD family protein n=1 Tax=unclassified Aurantimonas TaxID=2638230 RepID=UPI002E19161B|nr:MULTISPECIES: MmgE/PrpD family protein [unclassified Aurantimonas]MEC5293460.1 MmgE/PrpD family protein [Aurantimonas sp. C2-3-R2]MEC5383674.1 MmgE/PrpD family protein [Aurantimonas sp. C2-6-R+9]MEC5414538.1 MmgE/PrpD family protein [Aurantimonas sp. C2-4-R8]
MEATAILADYVVNSEFHMLPQGVRSEAARSLLNWMGCAVGGSGHATVDRAIAALLPFAGQGQASLFGRIERVDALHAALMNGISSHVLDFDDTHPETLIHPTAPVVPALLALAEQRRISGADLLHAMVLGVEVECRIGRVVFPAHYNIGWHITGTAGVFGAAAAAGKLLGLNRQQMTWALGIAGTQSAGLREMFGSMCKSFHPGRAAQNGLASALLAQQNFTSSDRVIEAPRGFSHVMSVEQNFAEITKGLGSSFEITFNTYKPFPCGLVIHPAIDGCIQLRDEHGLGGDDIDRVELRVHPLVLELTGKKTPQTGLEGKFSVYHSAAAAITYGAAGEHEFSDACVCEERVAILRDRIDAVSDSKIHEDEVYITVTLKNGRKLHKHVKHAVGSLQCPMSDAALEAKFLSLTERVLPKDRVDQLIKLCWAVEQLDDAAELARAAAAMHGGAAV